VTPSSPRPTGPSPPPRRESLTVMSSRGTPYGKEDWYWALEKVEKRRRRRRRARKPAPAPALPALPLRFEVEVEVGGIIAVFFFFRLVGLLREKKKKKHRDRCRFGYNFKSRAWKLCSVGAH
jgi:hypothetical protein